MGSDKWTTKIERGAQRQIESLPRPFNLGNGTAAGNPENPAGYKTAYLWERIWARDSWMDLLGRFLHLEVVEKIEGGKKVRKEALIFPRYHQVDAVRKLVADARANGPGHQYLIQHSAGSGKSNSIAWLAHHLSTLHDGQDRKVFDSVIVITDRLVLNERFGTSFTATDELFWEQVRDDAVASQNLQQAGAANTRDDFAYALFQHLEELVVNRMAGIFFENPEVRNVIQRWMLDQVYDRIRGSQSADAAAGSKG